MCVPLLHAAPVCAAPWRLQLQYTWQALTLEGSPFKEGKTVEYLVDKLSSYSSLSSLSSLSSGDEGDAASAGAAQQATAE